MLAGLFFLGGGGEEGSSIVGQQWGRAAAPTNDAAVGHGARTPPGAGAPRSPTAADGCATLYFRAFSSHALQLSYCTTLLIFWGGSPIEALPPPQPFPISFHPPPLRVNTGRRKRGEESPAPFFGCIGVWHSPTQCCAHGGGPVPAADSRPRARIPIPLTAFTHAGPGGSGTGPWRCLCSPCSAWGSSARGGKASCPPAS